MATEDQATVEAMSKPDAGTRQRSKIGFPYMDLNAAIELAAAIHGHVGLGECDDDQLAAWSNQSAKSSTFRVQVYAARTFGVLEGEGGHHKLAELGRMVVDPKRAREGRAKAFLNVPLYKTIYDKYKGGVLPPTAALERDIAAMGVSEKQKERARQVFERSAEQAGFFEHGKNHLVMPGFAVHGDEHEPAHDDGNGGGNGGGKSPPPPPPPQGPTLDPLLKGLVDRLPPADSEWAAVDRAKWLQTAANIFDLIYKGDGGIEVRAAMAQRSPRPD